MTVRIALADRLREALARPLAEPPLEGDYPELRAEADVDAAVLIAVTDRPTPGVILTVRREHLRTHAGQIAFPGGRVDPDDGSPLEAAYREAEEEIGLARRWVRPLGYLDAYLSGTNYLVTPVVAQVDPDYTLSINPDEVAGTFEVPLRFLMDGANHQLHSKEWRGRQRRYYAMLYGEHYIWGVTAGIIRNLYERLYGS